MQTSSGFRCTLAILVRNELFGSRAIFDRIPWKSFDQLLVIDGNSTDGTAEFYQDRGIPVFRQKRRGLGAAMIEARERCTTDGLVFFHPDGNEDPQDIDVIRMFLATGRDFVVASRMVPGAINEDDHRRWRPRKWANHGFALIANTLWAQGNNRTSDVTNGLRGIRCAAWDRLELDSEDLTMDYQMVIRALKKNVTITEFPTREGQRLDGATNFASWSTGVAELSLIWREIKRGHR